MASVLLCKSAFRCLAALAVLTADAAPVLADIYQWEYVDPSDPSQGKQASTLLTPDGAGVSAEPQAILDNLNLTRGYFFEANLFEAQLQEANLTDAYLRGADLRRSQLKDAIVTNADMRDADVESADASGSNFRNAILRDANFRDANLAGANFEGADLTDARINADWTGARLNGAILTNAYFWDGSLQGATIDGAIIQGVRIARAGESASGLTEAQLYSTASYQQHNLTGVNIEGNLTGWDLSNQNLTDAVFANSKLAGVNWSGAHLSGAYLGHSNLAGADFTSTTLESTNFSNAILTGADFSIRDLSTVAFHHAFLTSANFSGSNLAGTRFIGTQLTNADLSAADLRNADLTFADLLGANLAGALVSGATFANGNGDGISLAQLYQTASYTQRDLRGVNLDEIDLSGVDLTQQDLSSASLEETKLSGGSLAGANLSGASLYIANLDGVDFTGATVRNANLSYTTSSGFTEAQFYSTASYQQKRLGAIGLEDNDMAGWDFSGHDLANAKFQSATLAGTNFTNAIVRGADFSSTRGRGFTAEQLYSTRSYREGNLGGINLYDNDLAGWDFTGQDLTGANFRNADLTDTNFSDATVRSADFSNERVHKLTSQQLYSTKSFQERDLRGIILVGNDLAGWDLRDQNLTNSNLLANLTGTMFQRADLRGSYFRPGPGGLRGLPNWAVANTTNTIRHDGSIHGLKLLADERLLIRDYDGGPSGFISIVLESHFDMAGGSTLQLEFEEDEWNSIISFAAQTPVELGGVLELSFATDVSTKAQIGRTFDIFDWADVNPLGQFNVVSDSRLRWDVSNLYTMGTVQLIAVVPEPAAAVLLITTLATIAMYGNFRRARASLGAASLKSLGKAIHSNDNPL